MGVGGRSYSWRALIIAIGLVDVNQRRRGSSYLARQIVNGYCDEVVVGLDISGLKDIIGRVENDNGIARDVGLLGQELARQSA